MPDEPYLSPVTDPTPPPIASDFQRTAWGAWWTVLWGILLFILWQLVMLVGILVAIASEGAFSGEPTMEVLAEAEARLGRDGDVIGLIAFATLFFVCPACWYLGQARKGWTGWEYLGMARVKWWQWPLWGVITIACSLVFALLAPDLGLEGPDPSMVAMASSTQVPLFLYLGVGIGAPLVEEFIFRGVLFRGWRESRIGLWGTIFFTSLLWAAPHVQYPLITICYIFVLGMVLGIAREKTGSLWVPVWMHALNNGLATLQMLSL